ncbi:MAG: hypothetical protein D3909_06900, partial [Candidatus Electrothrix sp. ATG1]|nr:hypothetical protein [Candidatus Electrothrix sp. ATG1]
MYSPVTETKQNSCRPDLLDKAESRAEQQPKNRMKKKKVFILCPWYDPYRVPLLRELAHEFDITVLFTMRKEVGREWQAPKNLPFR